MAASSGASFLHDTDVRQEFHWEQNQWLRQPLERGVRDSFPRVPAQHAFLSLMFLGQGLRANAPAPTPAGPQKAAFLTWPWVTPSHRTLFCSQQSDNGIYLGDTFPPATHKEAVRSRGRSRDGSLEIGVPAFGKASGPGGV